MHQNNVNGNAAMFHNDYLQGQQSIHSNPNIELTYRCPLQCPQCFRVLLQLPDDDPKKIEFKEKVNTSYDMPIEDLQKVVEFTDGLISFCGQFSDPVYHANFFDVLDLCAKYPSKKFMIHTSAHQKNIEWYKQAYSKTSKNVTWKFGLDGLIDTSPMYRINQNSKLIWDAMLLGKDLGVNVHWQYIVFKFNEHQIEEARSLAKKYNKYFNLIYTDRVTPKTKEIQASDQYRSKSNTKEFHD